MEMDFISINLIQTNADKENGNRILLLLQNINELLKKTKRNKASSGGFMLQSTTTKNCEPARDC